MSDERKAVRQLRFNSTGFKTREEDGPIIEGYFSVFNSDYDIWPGAKEQVAPGAFKNCLGNDIRALANHDTRLVLGRTTAGTLSLREDDHGLFGVIKINENDSDAMNLYARVQRGDISQCSFGFDILDEESIRQPDDTVLYIIREVYLYEVSVVTFPAYEETSVEAREKSYGDIKKRRDDSWRESMKRRLTHGS